MIFMNEHSNDSLRITLPWSRRTTHPFLWLTSCHALTSVIATRF